MNKARAWLDYVLKHNVWINKVFKVVASSAFKTIGVFVRMDDHAVIFSAHGRKYNDSPKAIYEYMLSQERFAGYRYYWALEDPENTEIPGPCIKIKADTFKYFLTALKCKYWVTCVNIERSLHFKKKKTRYLNTWHGIPIKTVGNDAAGRKDYDFSHIDYFCVSGEYEIDLYKRAFCVGEDHVIKTGMPRNDCLYNVSDAEKEDLKRKLGLPMDKKIILYAPTWRDSKDGGKSYVITPPMNIDLWEEKLAKDYVLLFRTHPYTNKLMNVQFNSFVRDYTNYSNINDLLKVSDILISDYSATIFDYSILERPIICFAYDHKEYAEERGFAMKLDAEMPGGINVTEDEVIERILNCDFEQEKLCVKAFKDKYIEYGGQATKQCVEYLFE